MVRAVMALVTRGDRSGADLSISESWGRGGRLLHRTLEGISPELLSGTPSFIRRAPAVPQGPQLERNIPRFKEKQQENILAELKEKPGALPEKKHSNQHERNEKGLD